MPRLKHHLLSRLGIFVLAGGFGALIQPAALAKKLAPEHESKPWGLWKPLVQPGAKWTLRARASDGESPGLELIVETYDVRRVGDADVARLRWSFVTNGKKNEGEVSKGGIPRQVAVTPKGAYLFSMEDTDDRIAAALKKPADFGDPPHAIDSTKHRADKNIEHRRTLLGRVVCVGVGPTKGERACANICFGDFCVSPEKGIVAVEGLYSPGDDDFIQPGFDSLTASHRPQ